MNHGVITAEAKLTEHDAAEDMMIVAMPIASFDCAMTDEKKAKFTVDGLGDLHHQPRFEGERSR